MNQDETLKDSVKTVEDAYRVSRKANQILAETKKTLDKSTKKIYGLTIDAFNLTGELMIKVFKEVLGKDVIMDRDNKKLKALYKKGASLSSSDCDINDLKLFQKIMKHHEVEYSIKKDCSIDGRFNIFFLAKDAELIEQALKRFIRADRFKDANQVQAEESQDKSKKTEKIMPANHENDKKSILEKLEKAKEKANLSNKNKEKVKEKKQELSRW